MINILTNIFDIFFPPECLNCQKLVEIRSKYLCFSCLSELPLTHFSLWKENDLEISFKGRIPLKAATSLLYFEKKGSVQKLMHELKYHNKPKIGSFLGKWLAEEMLESKRFEMIDIVIPVPLHIDREKKRGYNQVHFFAEALALALNAELKLNLLEKTRNSETQILKSRQKRYLSTENEFALNKTDLITNKHILLVDDTITSGATMQACADTLLSVSGVSLSIASMAYTV